MKKVLVSILAVSSIAAAVPAAAQGWQQVEQRFENLDRRIERGVRTGQLTDREAYRLRNEFHSLVRLERRYRSTGYGLSGWEREDLDRRFDALSARVRWERRDGQDYSRYDRGDSYRGYDRDDRRGYHRGY